MSQHLRRLSVSSSLTAVNVSASQEIVSRSPSHSSQCLSISEDCLQVPLSQLSNISASQEIVSRSPSHSRQCLSISGDCLEVPLSQPSMSQHLRRLSRGPPLTAVNVSASQEIVSRSPSHSRQCLSISGDCLEVPLSQPSMSQHLRRLSRGSPLTAVNVSASQEIVSRFPLSQPSMSQHLRRLSLGSSLTAVNVSASQEIVSRFLSHSRQCLSISGDCLEVPLSQPSMSQHLRRLSRGSPLTAVNVSASQEIVSRFPLSQPSMSQHLRRLSLGSSLTAVNVSASQEIVSRFPLSQPSMSQHLRRLSLGFLSHSRQCLSISGDCL